MGSVVADVRVLDDEELAAIVTTVATTATRTATTIVRRSLARRDVLMCELTIAGFP